MEIRLFMIEKNIDIVNIGNIIMDIIIKVTDKEIEDLKVNKGIMHLVEEERQIEIISYLKNFTKELQMGGAGPNALRCAATLGKKCSLAGLVSTDEFGKIYKGIVKKLKINDRIRETDTGITGSSVILVTEDGQRTMNTCLGNSRFYTSTDVPIDDIKMAKYLFITGYQWDTGKQIDAMELALKTAKEYNTTIAFDIADPFAVKRSKKAFVNVIENYADVVFANEEEAKIMYETNVEDSLNILSKHCEIAIVKLGKNGSLVKNKDKVYHIKANNIKLVDTTAAGDMYAGGFLYGLASEFDIKKCAEIANLCAESVIQNIGAKLPDNIKELVSNV